VTETSKLSPGSPVVTTSSYLMLPSDEAEKALPPYPDSLKDCVKVNEWWIVSSLVAKKRVLPSENKFCQHFYTGKIIGFEQLTICSTGFSGPDLLHLQRSVEFLGGKYHEFLTPKASLLICGPKPTAEKIQLTKDHDIPTVSVEWLWACIDADFKIDYDQYLWRVLDIGKPLSFPGVNEATQPVKFKKKPNPQHKVQEIKFKEIRAKEEDDAKIRPVRMPFEINDDNTTTQDISYDPDDSATLDMLKNQIITRPLGNTSPSKLNSPQKPTSEPDYNLDNTRDQAQIPESAKERTLALSAILESKIANRSQSENTSDGNSKKRRVKVLGRATSTSRTSSLNLDGGAGPTKRQQDLDMNTSEALASQKLEYDDVELMKKREKLMAALIEGKGMQEEGKEVEQEGGRRRSYRKRA
jgi:DNA replication regulator DPB11